ncbi:3-oxoacyl-ACP synthase [Aggregatimonas sangjinii]|uniref:3-oxoacyl-ACP synthase n=1 Tax=Aggregatimonas sangjinii TaxID=2583587 RepID=A0A5B7SXJ9_9FLAO|nr:3-oxoacyl-ACP synthase [Aggregatimonas sangjinii]QCX02009.1 3-oxoacyl-ACP synthase [Aggregatimonas sangjinii]
MMIKEQLYAFCKRYIENRLSNIQDSIKGIQEALNSETKSSAGDKHETGRAMLQLEREKLGQQLAEAEKMETTLSRIPIARPSAVVTLGSWVKASKADYFLAVSAGECVIGDDHVFCISAATPIGVHVFGKSVGDFFTFNGERIEILEIR